MQTYPALLISAKHILTCAFRLMLTNTVKTLTYSAYFSKQQDKSVF